MTVLEYYVTLPPFPYDLVQALPVQAGAVLKLLSTGYVIPTALALLVLTRWLEGATVADRLANQRAVLRAVGAALFAWGLAALGSLAWRQALSITDVEWALDDLAEWHGPPAVSVAAAVGFALAAVLWRRDWHWGLAVLLMTGLRVGAHVCCGFRYPLDVVVGALLGAVLGWLLGSGVWPDRFLNVLIRPLRRWMLA